MICAACESPAPNPAVIFTYRSWLPVTYGTHQQLRFCSKLCVPTLWRNHDNHDEFQEDECGICRLEWEIARKHYSGPYQHANHSRVCEECGTELEVIELGSGMCVRCAWLLKN